MKGLNLFLAMCFAVPMSGGAVAAVAKNSVRTQNSATRPAPTTNVRNTATIKSRTTTTPNPTISSRPVPQNKNVISRTTPTTTRTASGGRTTSARTAAKQNTSARSATSAPRNLRSGLSRAATNTIISRDSVMQRDFGKCKSVFFDCMDEFCANKDSQLKRCACSTRSNEFSATQKSLDNVEDKLLDFSQRLLQVNMDPADAAVINRASEGELAYYATADKTSSKKALDEIAKKLNTNFDSAGNNMSALSWSLDIDSAFDSVDPLSGTATTAKSGVALRNAALPICRDMATEVCSPEDITLVENSYNMAIEQDCNTVKKSFETQTQSARTKILESSALLDMTRLNNYQENNSDDILTCKSKMLDMLTDTNVCGENLTKCLDVTGRYINPTTGEAVLSPELINLSTLITRPSSTDTWAHTPQNASFVSYLNNKKKYIEPATKNCQTIADDVWTNFIEDALAQIKLAQNAKLEEVRQSCTTLLGQCLENSNTSLAEFDSRALSTFGVISDKTANALCENIRISCNAITQFVPDDATPVAAADTTAWSDGVRDIAANETYNKILNTCREIGRDCIINSCKSITGNFGLCESINGSVNRHSILTRAACWNDVYNCVSQASDETINNIHALLPSYNTIPNDIYQNMYGTPSAYDICSDQLADKHPCYNNADSVECYQCRIAEQIWGNCEHKPDNSQQNQILIPENSNTTTLLSWFAKNTHTDTNINSCATSICEPGYLDYTIGTSIMCVTPNEIIQCPTGNILCQKTITTPTGTTNCCETNTFDQWGNCCMNGGVTTAITEHIDNLFDTDITSASITSASHICTPNNNTTQMTLVAKYDNNYVFCTGSIVGGTVGDNASINCNGEYVIVDNINGKYYYNSVSANTDSSYNSNYTVNYLINVNGIINSSPNPAYCPNNEPAPIQCTYSSRNNNWKPDLVPGQGVSSCNITNTNGHWLVKF